MASIPTATVPARAVHPARRWSQLVIGLVLYGVAIGLMISAHVGLDPWTVFAQGWSVTTGVPIGLMTVLIGIVVLLLWIPLKQRPGIGTVLNVIVIGPVIDLTLLVVETPESLIARWVVFLGGLALLALATGLYIGAGFGPGPRDGLMTGAHARFGWPIWAVRTGVEVTVLATGWMLGGTVGLGTVAFALLIGPMVGVTLPRLRLPDAPRRQRGSVRASAASQPVPGGRGGGA
ncbi:YczE/YyaS/YitT family protein [Microcella sp.]|uniref:membrane protein YczE n=1 Tax=Microcella sp. TaxID=1913979 RepID=UPI00391D20B7